MPAQKAADDLWSHVYTIQLRTCFPTGAGGGQFDSVTPTISIGVNGGQVNMMRTYVSEQSPLLTINCQLIVSNPASTSSPITHLPILVALRILMAKSASVLRGLLSDRVSQIFRRRSRSPTHRGRWGALDVCSGGDIGWVCRVDGYRARTAHRR